MVAVCLELMNNWSNSVRSCDVSFVQTKTQAQSGYPMYVTNLQNISAARLPWNIVVTSNFLMCRTSVSITQYNIIKWFLNWTKLDIVITRFFLTCIVCFRLWLVSYYIPYFLWDVTTTCPHSTWWRQQMETFSALLALCEGNSPVTGEFSAQRPVTRSFDVCLICA